MTNNISKINKIQRGTLNEEYYFLSLVNQAKNLNILSAFDTERIQIECMSILSEQIKKYNQDMSSSIRIESAQSIMTSILYTIGLALKKCSSPDDAVKLLTSENMNELYHKGLRRINILLKVSKTMHFFLLKNIIDTQNIFYSSSLIDGIRGFFKLYNPEFSANEIHITADYLTFNPIQNITGIEFINKYLEYLCYENEFCSYFSTDDIHNILTQYNKKYQELLFNIFEVILKNALGCIICKVNIHSLILYQDNINYLTDLFNGKTPKEIGNILKSALKKLNSLFLFSDGLKKYLEQSLQQIINLIITSAKNNVINQIFVVSSCHKNNSIIKFSFGDKMDNDTYKTIVFKIHECDDISDKLNIIKENVHTLADLEDIIFDAELTEIEIKSVLSDMNLIEISALAKKYPYSTISDINDLRNNEKLLCKCIDSYIGTLSDDIKQKIILTADKISIIA